MQLNLPPLKELRDKAIKSLKSIRQDHKRALNPTPYKVNKYLLPKYVGSLNVCLLVSSADSFCKHFGSRSGRTKCGSKLLDNMMLFLKLFLKKVFLKEISRRPKTPQKKPQNNNKKSSRSKLLDTDGIPERIFRKKMILKNKNKKKTADDKNHEKIPRRQRVNL